MTGIGPCVYPGLESWYNGGGLAIILEPGVPDVPRKPDASPS